MSWNSTFKFLRKFNYFMSEECTFKLNDRGVIANERYMNIHLKESVLAYLGLSCTPSMYICQNLIYPSWLAVANTVPSGDRAPSLTRWKQHTQSAL